MESKLENFQFRLSDNLILEDSIPRKNIRWYDLIPCKYGANVVHIPAAFLKDRGYLPNVDLGDKLQYRLDFGHYRKNNKTIDELFADFAANKKYPTYGKMLDFCRFLYHRESFGTNNYGKKVDQAEKQFLDEFNRFKKSFFDIEEKEVRVCLTKREYALRQPELLKIFILYRSLKIKNLENPLDTRRTCCDKNDDNIGITANSIDGIFLYQKDKVSVAPLDGRHRSLNEKFIKQFYALLWVNTNRDDYEIKTLLDFLLLIRQTKDLLLNKFWSEDYYKNFKKGKISLPIGMNVRELILRDFWAYQHTQKIFLKENLLDHNIKIPLWLYCIAKLYIKNEMKVTQWHQIVNNIIFDLNEDYPHLQKMKIIHEILSDVNVESTEAFINLFNMKNSNVSNDNQKIILDFIFPNDGRMKSKKRISLEKHVDIIVDLYKQFKLRCEKVNVQIETNYGYNLVVCAYLYFRLKKIIIPKEIIKTFQSTVFNDRNKTFASLHRQASKHKKDKKNYIQAYYYYEEISEAIISRYYVLFNLKEPVDFSTLKSYRMNTFEAIFDFLKAAQNEFYKFTIV